MLGRLLVVLAVPALLVTACIAPPPGSRYPNANDGAPPQPIGPEDVADASLRADPILSAGNRSPYKVNGVTYTILEDVSNYRERGTASWYGTKFHGHKTSNGERYDLYQASAAHKTLPIPCYARVTNLDNGRSVVVRVNDRGPFHSERLIDLSYAAAVKLGYMEKGTARVEVEVINVAGVEDRRGSADGDYRYLQLGAFGSEVSAKRLQTQLQSEVAAPVFISQVDAGGKRLYRVRIGPMASGKDLLALQQQLQGSGYKPGQPLP